ncbi:MAG: response regulator [Candidatus Gastranaerophilales bacterium]|nr:response regulator [Candidatus Gastranaerophilales bacterium]
MLVKVVLIIDKRKEQSTKYKKILENNDISVFLAENFAQALNIINAIEPDLILISDSLDFDIKKAAEQIRVLTYNTRPAIVALSKSNHIQDKIDILDAGADDFLSEPINAEEFKARITAHIRRNFENCFSEKTMLFNSKISYKMIRRILNIKSQWAIMLIDIDNIEFYKEIYGELAADKLLQTYSAIIKSVIETGDYIGQFSDNDFIVITNDEEKAEKIANYLVYAFDTVVSKFYSQTDANRGFMFLHGDDEAEDKVNLVSTSIGVISNKYKKYNDVKQVISSIISTQKLAKYKTGSMYVIERPKISADNAVEKQEYNNNILIAEPDEALSLLLEATARLQVYNVKIVNEYEEIIPAIEEFSPAVIILDAGNSKTLRGLEICRKLKFETKNLKSNIIFTTTVHNKEMVLNAGADLYLPKPYELSVIFGWIKKFNENYNA